MTDTIKIAGPVGNPLALDNEKTRQRGERPLGLNAVGRPYGENYDPNYKMRHKPSYGHLRQPYGPSMRFVGDPPKTDERRRRRRQPQLAPLLDQSNDALAQCGDRIKALRDIENKLRALRQAMRRDIEKAERETRRAISLHQGDHHGHAKV